MKINYKDIGRETDIIKVFEQLIASNDNCFLLETLEDKDQPQSSSNSYVGINPTNIYRAENGKLLVNDHEVATDSPYFELRNRIDKYEGLSNGYFGGLVGYFSHEGISYLEPSLKFDYKRLFSDFEFGEYRDGLIYDQKDNKLRYFYYDEDKSDTYLNSQQHASAKPEFQQTKTSKDFPDYKNMIESASEDIKNGRVFQVVLANKYTYEFTGNLFELYKKLRKVNPSPFMFFIKFGKVVTMGASPELLAHTKPNGDVYLEALAGTVKRTGDNQKDKTNADKLLADEKEIAEHKMLVDLARNDVGRISKIGSVSIENLMYIKRLSHVQHIASIVKGRLADDKDMFDSLASSFPAGTLSGAPKIEAIKMIAELENTERGPYGGTIGYFGFNGDSMHAVNIRSISAKGNKMYLHSGSGIVYDSSAEREFEEIHEKKQAMEVALTEFLKDSDD